MIWPEHGMAQAHHAEALRDAEHRRRAAAARNGRASTHTRAGSRQIGLSRLWTKLTTYEARKA